MGKGLATLVASEPGIPAVERPAQTVEPKTRASVETSPADRVGATGTPPGSLGEDGVGSGVGSIPVDAIVPSPFQPRSEIDPERLAELIESIRASGVLQPILVRAVGASGRYELIAGERRWRASMAAGLETIPAIVREASDEHAAQWALVENVQREDLDPIERAGALARLSSEFGWSQQQLAERVGLQRSTVANLMRLGRLEPEIRELVSAGALSGGHARALLAIEEGVVRVRTAARAVREDWSVRQIEREVRRLTGGGSGDPPAHQPVERSPDLERLERRLGEHLGTKVQIKVRPGAKKGRIQIEFFDLDHFDSLLAGLGFRGDDAGN